MMEVNWKLEPYLINKLFDREPPKAHALKVSIADIQGKHVKIAFALCDQNHEALAVLETEYVMQGSVLTLCDLDRSFTITVSDR